MKLLPRILPNLDHTRRRGITKGLLGPSQVESEGTNGEVKSSQVKSESMGNK